MSRSSKMYLMAILGFCFTGAAPGSGVSNDAYVATNDNNPNGNTTSVYFWKGGVLSPLPGSPYATGGYGQTGAYFASPTVAIRVGGNRECLFVSDTYSNVVDDAKSKTLGPSDIAAFRYTSQKFDLVGNYISKYGYSGYYGVGLAVSGNTLIANYNYSYVQEQWTIGSDCTLTETGKTITGLGGNGGVADGTVTTNSCYFFSGMDGTVGYATLSPFSFGGYVTAGGFRSHRGIPADIHVSKGNLFADDFGGFSLLVDAWAINSDCSLSGNITSGPLFDTIYSSNTMSISPNGKYLYGVGSGSGTVTTAIISGLSVSQSSCPDATLYGYGLYWSAPGESSLQNNNTGNGGWQFIAEAGAPFSNNSYIGINSISPNGCLTNIDHGAYPAGGSYMVSLTTRTD